MMKKSLLRGCATLVTMFLLAAPVAAQEKFIVLASTTSTANSGLLEYLTPMFQEKTGTEVRVVAVGTGAALELGRRGDADALLVHAPPAEKQFAANGYGIDRRQVMYNDFVIVGPADDPANVAGADSAADALQRIAEAEAPFASRGDDSGTHKKELSIWEEAGVDPGSSWYRELGSGMGKTLTTAAGMNAYTLADRGTWISFDKRQNLEILHEGDEILFNPYGSILVNPERHNHIKIDMSRAWHEWLVSEEGQQAIGDFRLRDQQLFIAMAD